MFYIVLTVFCLSTNVHSYVIEQEDKVGQNLSKEHVRNETDLEADLPKNKTARKHFDLGNQIGDSSEMASDNKLAMAFKDFIDNKLVFRTNEGNIKPKLVNFRSSDQPSLIYEVDSRVIMRALRDFLSSQLVARYTEDAARRAAVVFKSLRRHLE